MAASTPMKDTNTNKLTFTSITREESELLSEGWRHCVHIMLYSALPDDTNLFNNIGNPIKHTVMMQMRFDGRLGFPGGFVDDDDTSLEVALKREMSEEMGNLPDNFDILPDEYMFAHRVEENHYCLHFYAKEVTWPEFKIIEKRSETEPFEGFEVLGAVRVPLYKFGKNRGGLSAFLMNNFVGCARTQLLQTVRAKRLMSDKDLDTHIANSKIPDQLSSVYNE